MSAKRSKKKKTKSKRGGGRRSRCRHQIGGAGETYQLIDVDDAGNIMEIRGDTVYKFNTVQVQPQKTFHETYMSMIIRGDGSATQCYSVPATNSWYQLINMKGIIYQVSFDGERKRRVQLKPTDPPISDAQIADLIRVGAHSGTVTEPEWEEGLLKVLQTGKASVEDIKRVYWDETKYYLGGRWLATRLQQFTEKYPQYKDILSRPRP